MVRVAVIDEPPPHGVTIIKAAFSLGSWINVRVSSITNSAMRRGPGAAACPSKSSTLRTGKALP